MNLQELLKSYENKSGNGYPQVNAFSLKDDGDNATVKILLDNEQDVLKFTREVHMLKIGKYDNPVVCNGVGCKACEAGIPKKPMLMMPLYNDATKQVELWKRGMAMLKDLQVMLGEYGKLSDHTFKIIRSGKAGSKDTKYTMMYVPKNIACDKTNADAPKITGRDFKLLQELTNEQMEQSIRGEQIVWTKKSEVTESDEGAF